MSVARFIAAQRAEHNIPHTLTCALLGVSLAWFYKWIKRSESEGPQTDTDRRRLDTDAAVKAAFDEFRGLYGSPRVHVELVEKGWQVSVNTVADSMRRQNLVARIIRRRRRRGLTKQDKKAAKFPDLVKRDFTAARSNQTWVSDITEIPTEDGKLYLATVIDLYSRRLVGSATSLHPDAELAEAVINMAVAARGGKSAIWRDDPEERVVFHSDRRSTYTAGDFTRLCATSGIRQSMGRVASCFDNAAAESFFSTLEWEVLSRFIFPDTVTAQAVVVEWCYDFYNHVRRHSTIGMNPRRFRSRIRSWFRGGLTNEKPSTNSGEAQWQPGDSVTPVAGRLAGDDS